jgi:Bacterial EndoU nuclease
VKTALIFTRRDFLDALRVDRSGQAMALDGPNDDGTSDERPERIPRHGESGDNGSAVPRAPAELRTRAEYYEAHLAADDSPGYTDDNGGVADGRADPSGWDAIDVKTRPSLDSIRVTPERTTHILDGDETGGGGHRHGVGKPGKTEFPASWDDAKIISTAVNVAGGPDRPPVRQDWNDTWLCTGTRDGVDVSVVVMRSGEILTSWPEEGGPGVVRNPRKGHHD